MQGARWIGADKNPNPRGIGGIRDLDEVTNKDDIVEAIRSQIKKLSSLYWSAIKSIRQAYASTQTAVISLPATGAKRLLEAPRIKIGWMVRRIRGKPILKKSFRCLEYRHLARACTSEDDRSQCCAKCGEKGHFAKKCDKRPSCVAYKNNGEKDTDHRIGSWKCTLYQKTCKRAKWELYKLISITRQYMKRRQVWRKSVSSIKTTIPYYTQAKMGKIYGDG